MSPRDARTPTSFCRLECVRHKYASEEREARMKITNVEPMILYAQDDSMEGEANVGGYTGYQVVVRVDTDEGIHGWGEACVGSEHGEAAYAVKELIERGITPRVKGENPIEFRKI